MHDLIRTLDLKLYSVLPGGQIYIFFFCFFYNQPVLITLFGKASRWSEASVQICMKTHKLRNIAGAELMIQSGFM